MRRRHPWPWLLELHSPEPGTRHPADPFARGQLGGIGRAHDGADVAEAARANRRAIPLGDRRGDVLIDFSPAAIDVLEQPRSRIARADKHEHAPAAGTGTHDERLDRRASRERSLMQSAAGLDARRQTLNPYLGRDAVVEPFIVSAGTSGRGVFVLVRTSNPGAGLFQDIDCGGRKVYQHVASAVAEWNRSTVRACGLGDIGAVVGATNPTELAALRKDLPDVWFLVPGYGAQGATAKDVAAAFRPDGLGAIINSSRGITFPFHPDDANWEQAIVAATERAIGELGRR